MGFGSLIKSASKLLASPKGIQARQAISTFAKSNDGKALKKAAMDGTVRKISGCPPCAEQTQKVGGKKRKSYRRRSRSVKKRKTSIRRRRRKSRKH